MLMQSVAILCTSTPDPTTQEVKVLRLKDILVKLKLVQGSNPFERKVSVKQSGRVP